MNNSILEISTLVKTKRKELGLTQTDLSIRTGLGLRFIREIEQAKKTTIRMDKILELLAYLGYKLAPVKIRAKE